MSLHRALDDCLINFDRRVLVTDLLEEYELTYKEVHDALEAHIKKQEEAGKKFEKRFLVHGEEQQTTKEIFTIVLGESKQQEWLRKLKNAETVLYSIEIAGGAKAPATILKPMKHCAVQVADVEQRATATKVTNGNATTNTANGQKSSAALQKKESTASQVDVKPATSNQQKPQTKDESKKSPPSAAKSTAKKGSINNFFAPASTKTEEKKETKNVKATTPKKMEHFFKKQSEMPKINKTETETKAKTPNKAPSKDTGNTSMQLFTEESEASSDEEDKLDVLRRDVITTSDQEMDATTATTKRRRIIDSDDDDEPQQKHEKVDETTISIDCDDETDNASKSETYLDEDGFVITKKIKKPNTVVKKKTSPPASTKKDNKKISPTAKSTGKAATTTTATKTKQGNIMNFFSKK